MHVAPTYPAAHTQRPVPASPLSHAAVAPWDGTSALTACLETFRLIDAQRVHFRDGVRVHGFVTDGGARTRIATREHALGVGVCVGLGHVVYRSG